MLSTGLWLAVAVAPSVVFADDAEVQGHKVQSQEHRIQLLQVVGQAGAGREPVITQAALENQQADDLDDIFRAEPAITAGGAVGMSEKIYVRGIGEDILSITVDGAEQANAVFHHAGRIALEPELLKRVDVEAGAGSATAGPGALGGAVKFTTKDPADLLQPGKPVGALLKTGVASKGDANKTSVTLFAQDSAERLGAMVSFVQSKVDNLEDGNGAEIIGTESDQALAYTKVVANITDEQYLSLSYENIKEAGDVLYRPEWVASALNVAEPTEGERNTLTLNYGFTSDTSDDVDLFLTIYTTDYFQSRAEQSLFRYEGAVNSSGLNLQNTSHIAKHTLIYGLNYRDDKSYLDDAVNYDDVVDNGAAPVYQRFEETGSVQGIYLQDRFYLTKHLSLSAGLRYDEYTLNDEAGLAFSASGFSPNISAHYAINNQWAVSAAYAQALRGPEVEDAFRVSSSDNDANLEAETANTSEWAVDYQHQGLAFSAGVFKTRIANAILRNPPWSTTVTNLDQDIKTAGYFFNLRYTQNTLDVTAKYLSADTQVEGQTATRYVYGSKATRIGDTLVFTLDYRINDRWQAGWLAEIVRGINDIYQQVGGESLRLDKKGYSTHDIYLRWLPRESDRFALTFSIDNLFDRHYLSHASIENYEANAGYQGIRGSPEPGRDIGLTASLTL
ncbi:MAG: TonB-dependent receptor [Cellvibrionaceae bacterium]|nr:TonB-dependent receptor [Cellvibrionaceae bacterium]